MMPLLACSSCAMCLCVRSDKVNIMIFTLQDFFKFKSESMSECSTIAMVKGCAYDNLYARLEKKEDKKELYI